MELAAVTLVVGCSSVWTHRITADMDSAAYDQQRATKALERIPEHY